MPSIFVATVGNKTFYKIRESTTHILWRPEAIELNDEEFEKLLSKPIVAQAIQKERKNNSKSALAGIMDVVIKGDFFVLTRSTSIEWPVTRIVIPNISKRTVILHFPSQKKSESGPARNVARVGQKRQMKAGKRRGKAVKKTSKTGTKTNKTPA